MKFTENKIKNILLPGIFSAFLWGSAFPVLKITYEDMNLSAGDISGKMILAGIRFFFAGLILLLFARIKNNKFSISLNTFFFIVLLGILQTSLQYFFFYNGLANTSGIKGAVLASAGIFFTAFFSPFVYKNDRLTIRKQSGLLLGLAGIILINWNREFHFQFSLMGEGFLIFSGIVSAFGNLIAKNLSQENSPLTVSGLQMTIGSLFLFMTGSINSSIGELQFHSLSLILLFYSSFLSAAAFGIWYYLLKHHKPGEISLFKFLIPVFGAFLSFLFLPAESLNILFFAALILVSTGIIIIFTKKKNE